MTSGGGELAETLNRSMNHVDLLPPPPYGERHDIGI